MTSALSALCLACLPLAARAGSTPPWPDVAAPLQAVGGGEKDAAVIVAIERYAAQPGVAGAQRSGQAWYDYLTRVLKLSPSRTVLLNDASAAVMRDQLAKRAAGMTAGGRLWFVFIGHGAPAPDGKDGLLVGYDAPHEAERLRAQSVPIAEALSLARQGRQEQTLAILDAGFTGWEENGKQIMSGARRGAPVAPRSLDPSVTLLLAAGADQSAGALPGESHRAFSYLVLGALRGWADTDRDGHVMARELLDYVTPALRRMLPDRPQTPQLLTRNPALVLAPSGGEKAPPLPALAAPAAPAAAAPASTAPARGAPAGKLDATRLFAEATATERDPQASPEAKAAAWCRLTVVSGEHPYRKQATDACTRWSSRIGGPGQGRNSTDR